MQSATTVPTRRRPTSSKARGGPRFLLFAPLRPLQLTVFPSALSVSSAVLGLLLCVLKRFILLATLDAAGHGPRIGWRIGAPVRPQLRPTCDLLDTLALCIPPPDPQNRPCDDKRDQQPHGGNQEREDERDVLSKHAAGPDHGGPHCTARGSTLGSRQGHRRGPWSVTHPISKRDHLAGVSVLASDAAGLSNQMQLSAAPLSASAT